MVRRDGKCDRRKKAGFFSVRNFAMPVGAGEQVPFICTDPYIPGYSTDVLGLVSSAASFVPIRQWLEQAGRQTGLSREAARPSGLDRDDEGGVGLGGWLLAGWVSVVRPMASFEDCKLGKSFTEPSFT